MPSWENLSVTIDDTWGEGGRINFDSAPIQKPRFRLRGIYLPRDGACPALSRYAVDFNAGYMVAWWAGVEMFPLGYETARLGVKLPPFDGSREKQEMYSTALTPIRAELNKMNNSLARLEGYMGVIYPDAPRVDRVQMTYISGAVLHPNGATTDLVMVQFNFADAGGVVAPLENGGGTGPPN
jgi:hypothetical protein